MYKLKDAAKRGSALLGAAGILVGIGTSAMPAFVSADSLNPLTKRSLTLSSSSPGWAYTDGSGNSTYAPPNSGANGQKTGNMFGFHNSTANGALKTMTFQYCTQPAGTCTSPGDDATGNGTGTITTTGTSAAVTGVGTAFTTEEPTGTLITTAGGRTYTVLSVTDNTHLTLTANVTTGESGVAFTYRDADSVTNQLSDLNVAASSPTEVGNSDFGTVIDTTTGAVKAVPGVTNPLNPSDSTGQYAAHSVAGNYVVFYDNAGTWTQSTGWTMSVANVENGAGPTHRNNYIILANSSALNVPFDTPIQVIFFGRTSNYITNPGAGAFFVKINTYNVQYDGSTITTADLEPASDTNVVDGGVTVANVMNQSIQITTKVLETMEFSVGTVDPDTLSSADGSSGVQSTYEKAEGLASVGAGNTHKHGSCDNVLTGMQPTDPANVLQLGNQNAESSLETDHTFSTHSFWRLSSNSSAGATVYYSGHTLSNTENDQIAPINNGSGTKLAPNHGTAQFGLALDNSNGTLGTNDTANVVDYGQEATYENGADNGQTSLATTDTDNTSNASYHDPQLYPLVPLTNYADGTGGVEISPTTEFAFNVNSDTIPAAVATESSSVVDCVTAKVRYAADIAATTPAGIYTTKINWIAAPQY